MLDHFSGHLQAIIREAADAAQAPIAIITHREQAGLRVLAALDNPANPFARDDLIPNDSNLFCLRTVRSRQFLHVDESSHGGPPLHYLSQPIFMPNGDIFGAISVKEAAIPAGLARHQAMLERFAHVIEDELQKQT